MDEVEQVVAYAEADFDAGHASCFRKLSIDYLERCKSVEFWIWGVALVILVVGSHGRFPNAEVVGVDGAPTMLERAASEPGSQGLNIKWVEALLDGFDDPQGFDFIFSNSLLHHLHKPEQLWVALKSLGREDGWIHISDLRRPPSRTEAKEMVETYSGASPTCSRKIFTIRCVPLSRLRKFPDNAARLDFKNFMLRRLATGMFLFTDDWTRQNETRLDLR